MDQKPWMWKKRSTEKTLVAEKATNSSLSRNEEATEELLSEKAELERDLRVLNDKLSSVLSECDSKDSIAKKQVKIAQEAIAGWEKADAEAISLRNDLDMALQQKAASDERLGHLEAALKECMQQLRFVREEHEKRIQGALVKTSEFEMTQLALDQELAEAGKKLVKLDTENAQLKRVISGKDKVIEELSKYRAQAEVELNALILRVESTEKEKASLKYEVRVLEKELDIRNEEREFNRRTADVAQTKYQESVKRIANLESECQRLRILVQKRLPGPAAVRKMKNEVEMLGKDPVERRRRRQSNPSMINSIDMAVDTPSKRIDLLTEQVQKLEEENKCLKYDLTKRSNELQFSRARQANGKSPFFLQEKSVGVSSDVGSDDKASCGESWASALISELEHFKNEKQLATPSHRNIGAPELNLMDDFAEMEKMAVVSVDYPPESSSEVSEFVLQTSPVKPLNLPVTRNENKISTPTKTSQKLQPNVRISVHKILDLLEGINISSQDNSATESLSRKDDKFLPYKSSDTPTGYTVRVFQWRSDDLSAILQQFAQTCNDLLNGTADLEQFAQSVASSLDWITNHCFSIQDVSSMKDTIKNHLDWDESRSESEVDNGSANHSAESNRQQNIKGESLKTRHKDPKDLIRGFQPEMETTNQSEGRTRDQIKKQMIKENLETQLVETKLGQTQNISYVENNQENENNSSKRLEETRNNIKLQVKSMTRQKFPDQGENVVTQLRSDWEITAASAKLAECQETILSLGKELKALASPRDAASFDRVMSTTADTVVTSLATPQRSISHRLSLRDKMQAEDSDQIPASPRAKDDIQNGSDDSSVSTITAMESRSKFTEPPNGDDNTVASMAIVPLKKKGGRSFWRKLFWQHTKGNSKKRPSHKLK